MIITSTVGARLEVDAYLIDQEGAESYAHDLLRMRVVLEGEQIGAFIRPQSVVFSRLPPDLTRNRVTVAGWWSPDSGEGVELRGGACDGEVISIPRDKHDQRPPGVLGVPNPRREPSVADISDGPPVFDSWSTNYRRIGIDSEKDRWVYQA